MLFPLKLRLRHLDGQAWRDEESQMVGTIRHENNGDVTFQFRCESGETRCVRRPRRDVTLLEPDLMRSVVERQRLERG